MHSLSGWTCSILWQTLSANELNWTHDLALTAPADWSIPLNANTSIMNCHQMRLKAGQIAVHRLFHNLQNSTDGGRMKTYPQPSNCRSTSIISTHTHTHTASQCQSLNDRFTSTSLKNSSFSSYFHQQLIEKERPTTLFSCHQHSRDRTSLRKYRYFGQQLSTQTMACFSVNHDQSQRNGLLVYRHKQ